MRVLVVLHGWLPEAGRPSSGGALRAWHHGEALRAAGHEVRYATRAQDAVPGGPLTFGSPAELRRLVEVLAPDRIVCVQPEEAPAVAGLGIPLCVDLYAPRLLEAAWQDAQGPEAVHTLRALAAADEVLFSNPRQRWFYLGLMALAGFDLRAGAGRLVPLVAPEGPRRRALPREPRIVMGGVSWPWQDPVDGLRAAVEVLARRGVGEVVVYGGSPVLGESEVVDLPARLPAGPHLRYAGLVPWAELLRAYAGATLALDVMAPNAERQVALAFRQVDYLGCGLPILTGPDHALSEAIERHEAGWVTTVEDLPATLEAVLDDPDQVRRRGRNARRLARQRFARQRAEAPLVAWVEEAALRERRAGPLPRAAELAAALAEARARSEADRAALAAAREEVVAKREENAALSAQVRALTGSVERLSRAVDEVAGYRREAIRVLGGETEAARGRAEALAEELVTLRSDHAKKQAELRAALSERDRLATELAALADAHDAVVADREALRGLHEAQRQRAARLERAHAEERARLATVEADRDKKQAELEAAWRERDRLAGDLERAREAAASLERRLAEQSEQVAKLQAAHDRVRAERDARLVEVQRLEALRDQLEAVLGELRERLVEAERKAAAAGTARDQLAGRLARAEHELAALRDDVAKKTREVAEAAERAAHLAAERDRLAAERDALRDDVDKKTREVAEAAERAAHLAAERDSLAAERDALRDDVDKKTREVAEAAERAAHLAAERDRLAAERDALRDDVDKKTREVTEAASHIARLEEQRDRLAAERVALEADIAKKNEEIAAANERLHRLEERAANRVGGRLRPRER